MQDRDELAKYICDRIEKTLLGYDRKVTRATDYALIVSVDNPFEWRILVRRTGILEFEPLGDYSHKYPIPNLVEHIRDALADEYDFIINSGSRGGSGGPTGSAEQAKVELRPRPLPNAPYALPVGA